MPPNPVTRRATSRAAAGGQTDKMRSERPAISASPHPVSPAAAARSLVAALRPSGTHSTRCPAPARHCPTAAPISPGCRSPIVTSPMPLFHQVPKSGAAGFSRTRTGVNSFPRITPTRTWPAGHPMRAGHDFGPVAWTALGR